MPNRMSLLAGLLAVTIMILTAALAVRPGRQPVKTGPIPVASPGTRIRHEDTAARPISPAPNRAAAAPSDAQLREWIAGGWAHVDTRCGTDTGGYYNADGRYGEFDREGYWRIENGTILVEITHDMQDQEEEPYMLPVRRSTPELTRTSVINASPNRMTLRINGENQRFMRCPEARQDFTIPVR